VEGDASGMTSAGRLASGSPGQAFGDNVSSAVGSAQLADEASLLHAGDVLAGKYRILRLIGRGGMAEVYAATHEILQQTVAIKILLPDVAANAGAAARFINEARAAARIRGEYVAAVTDVGSLDDGSAYMVLEYLEGEDLEDYAGRIGPLDPGEAVDFVLQALQALAQAHALGFVHRDIKPSNLYLSKRPDGSPIVKVLDFGISKAPRLSEGSEGHATSTRTVLGSPYYMAPEQARSARSVDPRADQWAIGVTLYRLLTGELPFGGETLTELLLEIVEANPLRPRSYRSELPEGLEAAVMRCLRKDRTERFAKVAELAQALQPFAGSEGPAVERICRTLGVARSALPAPAHVAPAVPQAPAMATMEAPAEAPAAFGGGTAVFVPPVVAPSSTVAGKPPSSGGATAPTMPAPPMPRGASPAFGGTQASAGTHASWAESSRDVPGAARRVPRWVVAGGGALGVVGVIVGIVFAVTSGHGSRATAPATAAIEPSALATAAAVPMAIPSASSIPAPPPAPVEPPASTAAVVLSPAPPARVTSVPAPHGATARPSKGAAPPPSARPGASPSPATASPPPAPAQDAYDVLNQRN
jgi:tRNA A-37 threonylcarbamoyl transferase component Bud32